MLDVKNLSYAYRDNNDFTISDIDINIKTGESLGLLGPLGSGKTTLQYILSGLLKDYEGSVFVNGIDLKSDNPDYYSEIGVMFEKPKFYRKFSALENLRFFSRLYNKKCDDPKELLDKVGLKNDMKKKVFDYSYGMLKRLGMAKAMLNFPSLLILDEPTKLVDSVSQSIIKKVIRDNIKNGMTVFIATQNPATAEKLCDKIAFFADGKIVKTSSFKKLKSNYGQNIINVEYLFRGKVIKESLSTKNMSQRELLINILRGKEIQKLHSKEATLEQIYLNLTGKELN